MMSVMLMLGTGGSFWVLMRVMSKCSRLFLGGEKSVAYFKSGVLNKEAQVHSNCSSMKVDKLGNERDMSRREWMGMMSNNGV
jgi:hypothetical protein